MNGFLYISINICAHSFFSQSLIKRALTFHLVYFSFSGRLILLLLFQFFVYPLKRDIADFFGSGIILLMSNRSISILSVLLVLNLTCIYHTIPTPLLSLFP
ncbi:Hypothetical protein YjcE [Bacillus subtilis subsp. subtilis str. BSP1]|nr:Hypothetical protein YjcE [Bacillus subtilis subsp. subtilis str. BSP1]